MKLLLLLPLLPPLLPPLLLQGTPPEQPSPPEP